MKIASIDPGYTTGVVMGELHDGNELVVTYADEIVWSERHSLLPLLFGIHPWMFLGAGTLPDVIVVESFRLFPHKAQEQIGQEFPSVQVIGIVTAGAHLTDTLDRIVFQPASCKSHVALKHTVPSSEHVRDAYKHMRYYLITKLKAHV